MRPRCFAVMVDGLEVEPKPVKIHSPKNKITIPDPKIIRMIMVREMGLEPTRA